MPKNKVSSAEYASLFYSWFSKVCEITRTENVCLGKFEEIPINLLAGIYDIENELRLQK